MSLPMKRRLIFLAVASLLLLSIGGAAAYLFPVLSAYSAKILCSCVLVAGRPEASVWEAELAPYAALVRGQIDRTSNLVTARALGLFPRRALYRPGLGCTLLAGTPLATLQAQVTENPRAALDRLPAPADTLAWPAGVDSVAVADYLARVIAEADPADPVRTWALVVLYQGKLIGEAYAPGFDRESRLAGWSMTKSVTSSLIGLLVKQGRLDLYAPAPIPTWAGDDRAAITLDQLLRMSSGLAFEEYYFGHTDATRMLFLRPDAGGYAQSLPLAYTPDTHWSYASGTTNILSRLIRDQFRDPDTYLRFPYDSLFAPLGMRSVVMEPDAGGTYVGSSFMWATARDWATYGQLYLQDGVWAGQRLLPPGWVDYSRTRTATAPAGQYAAHFWTNATDPADPRHWPDVPADAYYPSGFEGQQIVIIPSRGVVAVRLGQTLDQSRWDTNAYLRGLLALLPPL